MGQAAPIGETKAEPELPETVLVVDDSRLQRRILSSYLDRWGYRVIEAASGEEALEVCQREEPDLIVSDWMMPGIGGLEFCQRFREMRGDRYGYFILLTSKSDKVEVAQGLDVGADDFLTKPVNATELRARIRAGQRVLDMERQLTEKNRLISDTLAKMDSDLVEAQKLQHSLVRERFRQFPGLDISLLLQSAGHVGGDLVGAFAVSEDEIGVYSIDVSGHGIASALMTARLAAYFSGNSADQNIAVTQTDMGKMGMRSPAKVAEHLNTILMDDMETELYLTLLLARVRIRTGEITFTQAGHPHPALQRAGGNVEYIGEGGLPVGLIQGAQFSDVTVNLEPGDRLFLGSDGITECVNAEGIMLDEPGLSKLLQSNQKLGLAFFDAFLWDLTNFAGDRDFDDDVSGVMLEFKDSAPEKHAGKLDRRRSQVPRRHE